MGELLRRFAVLALLLLPGLADATPVARWVQLGPPGYSESRVVFDSNRGRALLMRTDGVWQYDPEQSPRWTKLTSAPVLPDVTRGRLHFDGPHDRIWWFGPPSFPGGTGWVWYADLAAPVFAWTVVPFTGTLFDRLVNFASAYDAAHHRILVFGGNTENCMTCPQNKVYQLDLSGTPAWSQLAISGTPPAERIGSRAHYDLLRDRLVVYGGGIMTCCPSFPPTDETWVVDFSGTPTWHFLPPTPSAPAKTTLGVMEFDVSAEQWLHTTSENLRTGAIMRALDLSAGAPADSARWLSLPSGPGFVEYPTSSSTLWFDSVRRRWVCYGPGGALAAYSVLPPRVWTTLLPDSLVMPNLSGREAFVDPATGLLHVGLGSSSQTWVRSLDDELPGESAPLPGPAPRYWSSAVVDSAGGQALAFAGGTNNFTTGWPGADSTLWSYSFSSRSWTDLAPPAPPRSRAEALGVFDPLTRRLFIHGGRTAGLVKALSDTWVYDVGSNTWSEWAGAGFGGRWGEVGVYDPPRNRIIAFGGQDTLTKFTDVHVLDLNVPGSPWTPMATGGPPPIPPASGSALIGAAYSSLLDAMVVLADSNSFVVAWQLSLAGTPTWSLLPLAERPPRSLDRPAFALDPAGQRLVLTRGFGETWVLYLDQTTPTLLSLVSSEVSPEAVRLRWYGSGLESRLPAAYRSRNGAGWEARAGLSALGGGLFELEDRDVRPGDELRYRLGMVEDGVERAYGEVRIVVPAELPRGFALRVTNPFEHDLSLEFSLPVRYDASLELVDVSGRRVWQRDLAGASAGEHRLRIPDLPGLEPGVYFVRLSQGSHQEVTRAVRIR